MPARSSGSTCSMKLRKEECSKTKAPRLELARPGGTEPPVTEALAQLWPLVGGGVSTGHCCIPGAGSPPRAPIPG